ncbi:hypothetical protein [Mesorhizobium sp.]|uniref:hypothetical protein n=1 Tax=Mesorhizobium sp. TaxID=1871066 RepID=UPI000FEA0013|nr:hypothetical protein [Mesorhizobium sp.]RWN60177.1 MAG: hypothetical protein EOS00_16670 [Mesorhizobium sp.]
MTKNQILASVLTGPADDMPAIIATAINQWTSFGNGVTPLLEKVSEELEAVDPDLREEFTMALEDWQ